MSEEPNPTGDQMEAAAPVDNGSDGLSGGQERQVPLDALQAERAERQRLQDELKMIKDNMSLMMSQQQQQQSAPKPKDDFDGLQDDDVLTVGEFKKAFSQKERQYQMSIEELRMTQKHPDYQEVVTQYLPEVLKNNPGLRNTLQQSQDFELAYHLAKNSDAYRSHNKQVKKNVEAEKMLENAQRSGSLASVGQNSPINQAKRYKDMSDAEFMQIHKRNLGYF